MIDLSRYITGHKYVLANIDRMLSANKFPKTTLLIGPASVGKSTLARALALLLTGIQDTQTFETIFQQLNAGKETARIKQFNLSSISTTELSRLVAEWVTSIGNETRVLILDEAHNLQPHVQESILKNVEYGVANTYCIMCTTQIGNLNDSFTSRMYRMNMYDLTDAEVTSCTKRYLREKGIRFEGVNQDLFVALLKQSGITVRGCKGILDTLENGHIITESDMRMFSTTFDISIYECIIKSFYTQPLTGIVILKGVQVDGILKKVFVDLLVLLLGGKDFTILDRAMSERISALFLNKDKNLFISFLSEALLFHDVAELISLYITYSMKATESKGERKELAVAPTSNNGLIQKSGKTTDTTFANNFRRE